jgi:hypothetical protein
VSYTYIIAVIDPDGTDVLTGPFPSKEAAEADIVNYATQYNDQCQYIEDATGTRGIIEIWTVNPPPTYNERTTP